MSEPMVKAGAGVLASVGALAASAATLVCCVPLAFAVTIGAAGVSAFFSRFRSLLLGLSVVLLVVGFWQERRARQCGMKGRLAGKVVRWVAVAVVAGMILFPQQIAGFIAERLSGP